MEVHPDRAGCSYLDGKGRYGTLFNYLKGDAEGAHIYVGSNLQGKLYIICNSQSQQIILNSIIPDLPEWVEEEWQLKNEQ